MLSADDHAIWPHACLLDQLQFLLSQLGRAMAGRTCLPGYFRSLLYHCGVFLAGHTEMAVEI